MYSSDEDDYKNINFPTFIPAKKNIYEWNKLDFEFDTPFIFHNSRLNLEKENFFDLWENKSDTKKNVHITDNLQFHYNYKGKCIPFLLKIENISGIIQKGRHLPRKHILKQYRLVKQNYFFQLVRVLLKSYMI